MLRVAICHEKQTSRSLLISYCQDYFKLRGIVFEIKEYDAGESMLLEDFPDVLFLGICIGRIDGILVKNILQKLKADTRIIFVGEVKTRIVEIFGKNVYGFLEEPVCYQAFNSKLAEVVWDWLEEDNFIFCKSGNSIERISLMEVLYIESYGKYTKLYVHGREDYLLCEKCMGDWIVEQEKGVFLWCHRQFLVNILHIRQIQGRYIELEDDIIIPFSRRRRRECRDTYRQFIGRIQNYEKRCGTIYGYFKEEL